MKCIFVDWPWPWSEFFSITFCPRYHTCTHTRLWSSCIISSDKLHTMADAFVMVCTNYPKQLPPDRVLLAVCIQKQRLYRTCTHERITAWVHMCIQVWSMWYDSINEIWIIFLIKFFIWTAICIKVSGQFLPGLLPPPPPRRLGGIVVESCTTMWSSWISCLWMQRYVHSHHLQAGFHMFQLNIKWTQRASVKYTWSTHAHMIKCGQQFCGLELASTSTFLIIWYTGFPGPSRVAQW
jgi:hypothetical protein